MGSMFDLKQRWKALQQQEPNLRIRNAADVLGVTELELLATRIGDGVVRLDERIPELIQKLQRAGRVMALSRNQQVVHEKKGIYQDVKVGSSKKMGLCLGDIDLRMFFFQWRHAFAVEDVVQPREGHAFVRRSFQFFNAEGLAIHKVYAIDQTDLEQWHALLKEHVSVDQEPRVQIEAKPPVQASNNGDQPTQDEVRKAWEAIRDVHEFNGMLKRLKLSRLACFKRVGEDYAKPINTDIAEMALTLAEQRGLPIMVFVGNVGIVQIHTGRVNRLLRTGPWFNVLDPDFNLHLNTELLTQAWRVKRPTDDGVVTSLEFYNANDELVLTLFGERKPGIPELPAWQQLVAQLCEDQREDV